MNELTVRGFDKELERRLRQVAKEQGVSLNRAALILLREGAGLGQNRGAAHLIHHRSMLSSGAGLPTRNAPFARPPRCSRRSIRASGREDPPGHQRVLGPHALGLTIPPSLLVRADAKYASLGTSPAAIGSPTATKTTGITPAASLAARAGCGATATMRSGLFAISSATRACRRPAHPRGQRRVPTADRLWGCRCHRMAVRTLVHGRAQS